VGSVHYAGLMRMNNFLKNHLSNGLSRDAILRNTALLANL
jgi:hypothetical protein